MLRMDKISSDEKEQCIQLFEQLSTILGELYGTAYAKVNYSFTDNKACQYNYSYQTPEGKRGGNYTGIYEIQGVVSGFFRLLQKKRKIDLEKERSDFLREHPEVTEALKRQSKERSALRQQHKIEMDDLLHKQQDELLNMGYDSYKYKFE